MWLYKGEEVKEVPDDTFGFVYMIRCEKNGKSYIGRKYFSKAGYKVVKGKRKKLRKESDWATYYGSSKELLADLELYGEESFKRTILRFCQTRGETNYQEAVEIINHKAIIDPKYYNHWLSIKITRKSVQHLPLSG